MVKLKRNFIWLVFFVLTIPLFAGILPAPHSNAQDVPSEYQDSYNRRYVAALVQCLQHFTDGVDFIGKIKSLDDWKSSEYGVVGVDMEPKNGVLSCSTALLESAKLLGSVQNADQADIWLENNILPNKKDGSPSTFIDFTNDGVPITGIIPKIEIFIKDKLAPYINSIPVTDNELARRLLPYADFCYTYTYTGFVDGGEDFNAVAKPDSRGQARTIHAAKSNPSANNAAELLALFKNDGFSLRPGNSNAAHIGDLELGFNFGGNANFGIGDWHGAYASDFLPLGADNLTNIEGLNRIFTDGNNTGAQNGTIKDCNVVKDLKDRIFPFYELDEKNKLTLNGQTAQEIVGEAPNTESISGTGNTDPNCESMDALGWIACPIIKGLYGFSEWVFKSAIVPMLTTDPINTSTGITYSIWSSMRTLGNIVLIFALLFVVIGQAIGGGLVDAYTAKKAMPRIFVGAILINLSISIVAILIDFTNVIGNGLRSLLVAPVLDAGYNIKADGGVGVVGLIFIVGLLSLLWRAWHSPKGSMSKSILLYAAVFFGIPILLTILGIFATLIVRMGTILLLTALSPVAMALFVLPSTEKYFKKWFDLFIKTLLVYPIVVSLFAIATLLSLSISQSVGGIDLNDALLAGGVAAIFAAAGAGGVGAVAGIATLAATDLDSLLPSIVSILVLFAPMVMIPFAFKLAGGLMGSMAGIATKARSKVSHNMEMAKHRPGVYNPHTQEIEYGALAGLQHKAGHAFTSARSAKLTTWVTKTPGHRSTKEALSTLIPIYGRRIRKRLIARENAAMLDRKDQAGTGGSKGEAMAGSRAAILTNPGSAAQDPSGTADEFIEPPSAPPAPGSVIPSPTPPSNPPPPPPRWAPPSPSSSIPAPHNNPPPPPPRWAPPNPTPPSNLPPPTIPTSRSDMAVNRFGNQQASNGMNTSNDGYITPSGIIVPDTDTVIKHNKEKNKQ